MSPFRCSNCNKLLGKIEGMAEIKCPKCKTMNRGISGLENCDIQPGTVIPYKPGEAIHI